jgi:hypothetical protein
MEMRHHPGKKKHFKYKTAILSKKLPVYTVTSSRLTSDNYAMLNKITGTIGKKSCMWNLEKTFVILCTEPLSSSLESK